MKVTVPASSVSTMIISHGETAEQRADRYRAALVQIMGLDQKRQYGSCPDCDHETWCKENRACKSMPHTEIGKIAAKALAEGE